MVHKACFSMPNWLYKAQDLMVIFMCVPLHMSASYVPRAIGHNEILLGLILSSEGTKPQIWAEGLRPQCSFDTYLIDPQQNERWSQPWQSLNSEH